jgi:hypothetical protein
VILYGKGTVRNIVCVRVRVCVNRKCFLYLIIFSQKVPLSVNVFYFNLVLTDQ